jgi:hypothetical protein
MDCSPKEEALHFLYCTASSCNVAYCLLLLCYLLPTGDTADDGKEITPSAPIQFMRYFADIKSQIL